MKVELEPGESVTITFKDSDGDLTIAFNEESITVKTDWPDSTNRQGIIYEEKFSTDIDKEIL